MFCDSHGAGTWTKAARFVDCYLTYSYMDWQEKKAVLICSFYTFIVKTSQHIYVGWLVKLTEVYHILRNEMNCCVLYQLCFIEEKCVRVLELIIDIYWEIIHAKYRLHLNYICVPIDFTRNRHCSSHNADNERKFWDV